MDGRSWAFYEEDDYDYKKKDQKPKTLDEELYKKEQDKLDLIDDLMDYSEF